MGYIYIITNDINNKVYIGQTIQTVEHRWSGHLYCSKCAKYCNTKIDEAIGRIGEEHFRYKVLCECYTQEELDNAERHYIEQYNSIINGYNVSKGGKGYHSKLYKYIYDIIYAYEIEGISSMQLANMYNCSDGTILNILKAYNVEIRNNKQKVIIIDLHMIFDNVTATSEYLMQNGIAKSKCRNQVSVNIRKACCTKHNLYGMNFMYYDEYINMGYSPDYDTTGGIIYERNKKCSICGKPITSKARTGMCSSCANVIAKGKSQKPTKQELQGLVYLGYSLDDIAKKYGRNKSTICYWKKQYNI